MVAGKLTLNHTIYIRHINTVDSGRIDHDLTWFAHLHKDNAIAGQGIIIVTFSLLNQLCKPCKGKCFRPKKLLVRLLHAVGIGQYHRFRMRFKIAKERIDIHITDSECQ